MWSVLRSGYCEIFTVQCKIHIFSLQRKIVIIKCTTYKQGSTQSKIGWELTKSGCHMRSNIFHQKSYVYVDVKLFIPITLGFCTFLGLSDKFGSQPLSMVANFGCFRWIAKNGCQNSKLAGNTIPRFPPLWSPAYKVHYRVQYTVKGTTYSVQCAIKCTIYIRVYNIQ